MSRTHVLGSDPSIPPLSFDAPVKSLWTIPTTITGQIFVTANPVAGAVSGDYYSYCEACSSNVSSTCQACEECVSCCECCSCTKCKNPVHLDDWCVEHETCIDCCPSEDDEDACPPADGKDAHEVDQVGWVKRGEKVHKEYLEPEFDLFRSINPATAMAQFYLLSYMQRIHDVTMDCSDPEVISALMSVVDVITDERQSLVSVLDEAFQKYVDIAVGGEIRHHPALARDGHLDCERERAWGEWISIRENVGPQALLDAAEIFRDMGGGFGGECWAAAADILYLRVTDQIPDWMFVDRVFTMQHNNGSLLNKVNWSEDSEILRNCGISHMRMIGNAHASNPVDVETLLVISGVAIGSLFSQWWRARNQVLVASGKRAEIKPSWAKHVVEEQIYKHGDFYDYLKDPKRWGFKPPERLPLRRPMRNVYYATALDAPVGSVYSLGKDHCPECGKSAGEVGVFCTVYFSNSTEYVWPCCWRVDVYGQIHKIEPLPEGVVHFENALTCPSCGQHCDDTPRNETIYCNGVWHSVYGCCYKVIGNEVFKKSEIPPLPEGVIDPQAKYDTVQCPTCGSGAHSIVWVKVYLEKWGFTNYWPCCYEAVLVEDGHEELVKKAITKTKPKLKPMAKV